MGWKSVPWSLLHFQGHQVGSLVVEKGLVLQSAPHPLACPNCILMSPRDNHLYYGHPFQVLVLWRALGAQCLLSSVPGIAQHLYLKTLGHAEQKRLEEKVDGCIWRRLSHSGEGGETEGLWEELS